MLKINEIFFSAQGEGVRVGIPSLFIRLSGCTAKCSYCDTKDSWEKGDFINEEDILETVNSFKSKYNDFQIVITGGEPYEQDIRALVTKLKQNNFFIAIETNGINYYELDIDWYAVSPKDVLDYKINKNLINKINEVKLIVNENLSLNIINEIRRIRDDFLIFLQPDFYNPEKYKDAYSLYKECLKSGIKNIRLGFQLHRLYGIE